MSKAKELVEKYPIEEEAKTGGGKVDPALTKLVGETDPDTIIKISRQVKRLNAEDFNAVVEALRTLHEQDDIPKNAKEAGSGFKNSNEVVNFLNLMFGINPTSVTGGKSGKVKNSFELKGKTIAWLDNNKNLFVDTELINKKFS